MSLAAFVKSLDAIPAAHQNFYVKTKGGFRLDVEPAEGLDLVDADALRNEADRLWVALEKGLRETAIATAVAKAGGNAVLLKPHLDSHIVVDRETFAVKVVDDQGRPYWSVKGTPGTLTDVIGDLRRKDDFKLAFSEGEVQTSATPEPPKAEAAWGGRNLTEYSRDLKAQLARKPSPAAGIKGNPWDRRCFNLTEQSIITKADPSRAEMLRAEAER